jgi:threonine/homoserine/homoserine lactone efflux protein
MKWMQAITGVILILLMILLIASIIINATYADAKWGYLKVQGVIQIVLALLFGYYGVQLLQKSNERKEKV